MNKLRFITSIALLLSALTMTSLAQSPNPWTFLGPQPIKSTNVSNVYDGWVGPMPIAGRVSSVVVVDAKTVYIGTSGGGVWKTTDGGASWRPKTDSQSSLTIGALALDPTNKNIIYAGTGEFIPYSDEYNGVGILRSSDAGETWALLPDPNGIFKGTKVARIAVDLSRPNNIYVATSNGLAISSDKGQSWSLKKVGICSSFTDVVIDSGTIPSTVYVASSAGDFYTSSDKSCNGIWKARTTDNNFVKANGKLSTNPSSLNTLPVSKKDTIRLAMYTGAAGPIYPGINEHVLYAAMWTDKTMKVYKSSDGGDSWLFLPGKDLTTDGPYQIAVQKTFDISKNRFVPTLYILSGELYLSMNDGQSWKNITSDSKDMAQGRKVHHDMHGFDFVPGYAGRFFLGNDGGIYKSVDYGETYLNLNDMLGNVHFYRGAVSNDPKPVVIGSMHDSGIVVSTGVNKEWTRITGGDGGAVMWDPQDTKRVYLTRADGQGPLVVYRSTSGGQGPFLSASTGLPTNEPIAFIQSLAMDPKNPRHLYVASSRLYSSVDGADSWQALGPPAGMDFPNADWGSTSIAVASGSTQVTVYVCRAKNVFRLQQKRVKQDQFENSWTNVSFNLPTGTFDYVQALAVDPTNPDIVYAGLHSSSGPAVPHLMKFNGTSWVSASNNLPNANVNSIVINPNSTKDIFIATDEGVYRSTNGGDNWFSINQGMPNAIAWDVVLDQTGRILYVFTHGRGVWGANIKSLPAMPFAILQPQLKERIALPTIHLDQALHVDAGRVKP